MIEKGSIFKLYPDLFADEILVKCVPFNDSIEALIKIKAMPIAL